MPLDGLSLRDVLLRYRERTRPHSSSHAPGADLVESLFGTDVSYLDVSIATLVRSTRPTPRALPSAPLVVG